MDAKQTGLFIAKKRKEKKLTQTELADLLQVTDKAISRWETGEGYPEISILPKLATLLGCSIDDILQGGQKEVVVTDAKRIVSKFQFFSALSVALFIFGYLINIILIYSTKDKFWSLLAIVVFGFASFVLYYFQRYKYLSECIYDNEDKYRVYKATRSMVVTSVLSISALLPHYLIVLIGNIMNTPVVSDYDYLRFGPYIMFAILFMMIGSIPLAIGISIYQKNVFGKPLLKKKIKQKFMVILSSFVFVFLFYIMIIDQYDFEREFNDTLLIIIPVVFIIPFLYPLIFKEKKILIPFILSILIVPGLYLAAREHHYIVDYDFYLSGGNSYVMFNTLILVGPGALIALVSSTLLLIKEIKINKVHSYMFFAYRNLIFISSFLILFFIGISMSGVLVRIEILSIIYIFTWYISDLYIKLTDNSKT